MLTDKEIEEITARFIRACGDHFTNEPAIPERDVEDFARAIEKAVLFDELKTWTSAKYIADEKHDRCGKCGRAFWHFIKDKMNLEK